MNPHYRKTPAANSRESAQSTAMALFGVSTTLPVTRLVVGSRFGWVIPKHLRNFYLIVSRRLSSERTSKPVLQRANGPVTRLTLVICNMSGRELGRESRGRTVQNQLAEEK